MALLIDWGGVLTTSVFDSFDAFSLREGLGERAVRRAFLERPEATQALVDLECGRIGIPVFEARLAEVLKVAPDGLARRLMADVRPDTAMRDAVRAFHDQGIRTVLVSNSWGREDYDADDLFDEIVLSGDLGIRKPDPRIYAEAVERAGVPPAQCIFVDDIGGNLKPARALGMTTIRHVAAASTVPELKRLLSSADPS